MLDMYTITDNARHEQGTYLVLDLDSKLIQSSLDSDLIFLDMDIVLILRNMDNILNLLEMELEMDCRLKLPDMDAVTIFYWTRTED